MGVDVWGRGSHGGGGFGSYKAISHIAPDSLGLSVALFGQAWTWESEQDKAGWTWDAWWNYERKLWLGSKSEPISVPEVPPRPGEPECVHGPFLPISSFFRGYPPPDPAHLAFHSSFCPGVGRAWFVEGVKVMQSDKGWTDIDKQCSLGDMAWPNPSLAREEGDMIDELPDATSVLCMDDAWNGGSSLRLSIFSKGFHDEEAVFRCFWLPVQSLSINSKRSYEASIIYKLEATVKADIDLGFSVKPVSALDDPCINITDIISPISLPNGWTRLSIQFSLDIIEENDECGINATVAIGLVIGIALEIPTQSFSCSILVGQLNVFACPPPKATTYQRSIIWADFSPQSKADSSDRLSGVLRWDTAVCLAASAVIDVTLPDDPIPVWTLDSSDRWFPSYLYFNIYLQVHSPGGCVAGPDNAAWIGTTGLDGKNNEFVVDVPLPEGSTIGRPVRLYVQGVTDRGEVLPWQQSVFVDVNR
jgi:mannosyl-glycoprotein endo-beta-N-acetylglucosaminidase